MDVTGLLMLPLAAIITATWIIIGAVRRREPTFRGPFLLTYVLAILLMQPWHIGSWQEAGMACVMLVMTAIPIAAGCIAGGIPAILIVFLARKLAHARQS